MTSFLSLPSTQIIVGGQHDGGVEVHSKPALSVTFGSYGVLVYGDPNKRKPWKFL